MGDPALEPIGFAGEVDLEARGLVIVEGEGLRSSTRGDVVVAAGAVAVLDSDSVFGPTWSSEEEDWESGREDGGNFGGSSLELGLSSSEGPSTWAMAF